MSSNDARKGLNDLKQNVDNVFTVILTKKKGLEENIKKIELQ